jgi:hypothetical protein
VRRRLGGHVVLGWSHKIGKVGSSVVQMFAEALSNLWEVLAAK